MFYLPVSLLLFVLLLLLVPFFWLSVTLDVVEVAAAKLGFAPNVALILLLLVILGSTINIPLYRTQSVTQMSVGFTDLYVREFWGIPLKRVQRSTVIAINVGGGVIPVALAL